MIVGSGPAGLECAATLLNAGQKVTVAEEREEFGGRVIRESRLPGLASWARVRDYRLHQLNRSADAELFHSSFLDVKEIAGFGADAVILATGAEWRRDGVGSTRFEPMFEPDERILSPDDVMDGALADSLESTCVVYDDDNFYMASVVAEQLYELGHIVVYATPQPLVASWTDYTLDQERIVDQLKESDIELMVNTEILGRTRFKNMLTDQGTEFLGAYLVMVGARLPCDQLHDDLRANQEIGVLEFAGDCVAPGTIQSAVLSGHAVARKLLENNTGHVEFKREQLICAH